MVVDSEATGKQLLEKGELKRRVTIIPLNKIAAKKLDDDVVKKAKKLVSLFDIQHFHMILYVR